MSGALLDGRLGAADIRRSSVTIGLTVLAAASATLFGATPARIRADPEAWADGGGVRDTPPPS